MSCARAAGASFHGTRHTARRRNKLVALLAAGTCARRFYPVVLSRRGTQRWHTYGKPARRPQRSLRQSIALTVAATTKCAKHAERGAWDGGLKQRRAFNVARAVTGQQTVAPGCRCGRPSIAWRQIKWTCLRNDQHAPRTSIGICLCAAAERLAVACAPAPRLKVMLLHTRTRAADDRSPSPSVVAVVMRRGGSIALIIKTNKRAVGYCGTGAPRAGLLLAVMPSVWVGKTGGDGQCQW